jgi:capsid assembly protease
MLAAMNRSAIVSYLVSRQWAMDPDRLRAAAESFVLALEKVPTETLKAAQDQARSGSPAPGSYENRDGVAHIRIAGTILKELPCAFDLCGQDGTSTLAVMRSLDAALYDATVKAIALDIDSPGGSIDGVQELADAIHAARDLKPITAHISDLGASAAFWLASQATKITANESARVGSIGVLCVVHDTSAAAAQAGVAVHVIRSSELKGGAVDGAPVTEAMLSDTRRIVDGATEMFVQAIARGRGVDAKTARKWATGQTWYAEEAKTMGLIDGITSSKGAHNTQRDAAMTIQEAEAKIKAQAEEISKLQLQSRESIEKLAAEKLELEAQVKALRTERRDAMMSKYADRVAPADLKAVSEYAEFCADDLAKLEGFLKARPVVTRDTRISDAGNAPDVKQNPDLTPEMVAVAKQMGNPIEEVRKVIAARA